MALSTDALHLRTMKLKEYLEHYRADLRDFKPDGAWKKNKLLEIEMHLTTVEEIEQRIRKALDSKPKTGGTHDGRTTDRGAQHAQSGGGHSGPVPGVRAGGCADHGQVQVPGAQGNDGQDFTLAG